MKPRRLKTYHFYSKLLWQKPVLRQIEWWLQNGPITKSGALPVTASFFWKIYSSFRISLKELIWCTNDPNVHIRIFRKCWSLILGCFFLVSILNFVYKIEVGSRHRFKLIYLDLIFMLHYGLRITEVCFNSISINSDYHNAVFVCVYEQRITPWIFAVFFSCSLPCHVLLYGGDTNIPSSCL